MLPLPFLRWSRTRRAEPLAARTPEKRRRPPPQAACRERRSQPAPKRRRGRETMPRAPAATRASVEMRRTHSALAENRAASTIVSDEAWRRRLGRRFSAGRGRAFRPAKRLVLVTNDADRKGSRALAVEGGANGAILRSPLRGLARQRGVLLHLRLEREALVRLEAVVHVGVQVRDAPRLHHLTTRRCGAALTVGA